MSPAGCGCSSGNELGVNRHLRQTAKGHQPLGSGILGSTAFSAQAVWAGQSEALDRLSHSYLG